MFPLRDESPTLHTPYVTATLIAVNLLVMVWLSLLSPVDRHLEVIEHGFVPARIGQLTNPNLVVQVPLAVEVPVQQPFGQPAQPQVRRVTLEPVHSAILSTLLTSLFFHGGWMHVLGNMWFLWIFGDNVEDRLGSPLYLAFYVVGGLLATGCHWAYDPHSTVPVIGASGAVATILGAYAVTFPKAKVRTLWLIGVITVVDIPALVWLGIWFVGQLFDASLNRDLGVAVWAHIGGFVAGAALMPVLSAGAPPPGTTWHDEIEKHFTFPRRD